MRRADPPGDGAGKHVLPSLPNEQRAGAHFAERARQGERLHRTRLRVVENHDAGGTHRVRTSGGSASSSDLRFAARSTVVTSVTPPSATTTSPSTP